MKPLKTNCKYPSYGVNTTATENQPTKPSLWDYLCVVRKGCVAVGSLQGIWSFLGNVSSLATFSTITNSLWIRHTYDGLACHPNDPIALYDQSDHCDLVAEQMANATATHPQWNCQHLVDGTVNLIFDRHFIGFKDLFISASIFSAIAALSAIVHDWALMYYHGNGIHKLREFHFSQLSHVRKNSQSVTGYLNYLHFVLKN